MIAFRVLTFLAAWGAASPEAPETRDQPSILLFETLDHGYFAPTLLPVKDGFLALVAPNGKLQFRSPAGQWSEVVKVPVQHILQSAVDDAGVLVSGNNEDEKVTRAFAVGVDGRVTETWEIAPELVRSLATWKGSRWAASDRKLLALLPAGKYETGLEIPKALLPDGHTIPALYARLYLGPDGERVFCVPEICEHDGPCHYGFCYRRDQANWEEFGKWTRNPISCGAYLLEPEGSPMALMSILPHHQHFGTVVRRVADGAKVASVKMKKNSVVACGGDNEFLVADTSVKAFQLTTGRRLWSVPVRSGIAVAAGRALDCVVVLTDRGKQQNVCRDPIRPSKKDTPEQPRGDSHGRNP
jgi:hypothetical protein